MAPPFSSCRVAKTDIAVIDNLLERYSHLPGLINLAPGAPVIAPSNSVLAATARSVLSEKCVSKYNDVLGWRPLRKLWLERILSSWDAEILAREAELVGVTADDDFGLELMVTAGANQAFVNLVLALCDAGDEVVLLVPYYFSHYNALVMAGVRPVLVACDERTLLPKDIAAVERVITPVTKAVVLVSPGNPSGVVAPVPFIRALFSLCKASNIWLFFDEAYKEISFDSAPGCSLPGLSNVVRLYTMSKVYGMAGWRVGAALYPKELSQSMRKVQDTIPTHASMSSQICAYHALDQDSTNLSRRISSFASVRECFISRLSDLYERSNFKFVPGNGAFYFFLPVGLHKEDVVDFLVRKVSVLVVPGEAFGMPGYVRVSYGAVPIADAQIVADSLVRGLRALFHEQPRTSVSQYPAPASISWSNCT